MNFCEEIILSFIDKVLLGGLMLLLASIVNRSLERYKSNIMIKKEFTIARINKISETWKSIIELEENSSKIIDKVVVIRNLIKSSVEKQAKEIIRETKGSDKELKVQIDAFTKQLELNQFWLGNDYYTKFSNCKNGIIEYYQTVMHDKDVFTNEIKEKLKDNKEDLFNVVNIQTKNQMK